MAIKKRHSKGGVILRSKILVALLMGVVILSGLASIGLASSEHEYYVASSYAKHESPSYLHLVNTGMNKL